MKILRVAVEEARKKVRQKTALLVSAYDSDEKFRQYHLEGAISLRNFNTKRALLKKDQELIFYCA